MIDNSQPLADLHDIVAAPAAHWWPLAPAWYLLALLVLAVLISSAVVAWRWHQRRVIRNAALRALRLPLADMNAITLILKQACLGYFDADRIAALTGPGWFSFLAQQLPRQSAANQRDALLLLAQQAYQQHAEASSAEYQQLARYWLRHALPPRSTGHD
jgi:hypothetical protein